MFWNAMFDLSDIGIHLLDNAAPLNRALKPIQLEDKVLDTFVGRYQFESPGGKTFTLRREGKQFFGQMGDDKYEILAASETELFLREIEVELTIVRNEKGQVDQIISHQNGQQETARRIQ
jgi:serine-type D-Ala-D-Ala carboxypeptidase/endopeptidase